MSRFLSADRPYQQVRTILQYSILIPCLIAYINRYTSLEYRDESKLERDTSQLRTPPLQIVREERRIPHPCPQRDQPAPRSTQPGLDELTSSRAERENVERTHGAETRHWQNKYYNLYLLKETVDTENNILKRELDQLKKQFVSTLTKQLESFTDGDKLEERQAVLLREKGEAVKERDEARTKLQLTEKRTKDLEYRIQNLLNVPQKKIQNIQMERDSYKAAAYNYKSE